MRKFIVILIVSLSWALLLPATSHASEAEQPLDGDGNPLTELPLDVSEAASTAARLVYVPEGMTLEETPTILVDVSKGILFDHEPAVFLANFVRLVNDEGYSLVVTPSGVLHEDLSQFDVFMTLAVFAATPYSDAELAAIDQYMDQGGNLFVAGEAQGCSRCPRANGHLNAFARPQGNIRLGVNTLEPTNFYYSNLRSHPVTAGVSELYYRFGGALDVRGSAITVAFSNDGVDAVVAVNDDIVVVGDTSFLSNGQYWDRADNNDFIINSLSYLVNGGDVPALSCASLPVTIAGSGTIVGTPGNDVILGSSGPDTIDGGGGDDVICSGGGDDIVNGGAGADVIYAGEGNDRVNGQGDNDRLYGGPGSDVLWGNADDDVLGGGSGNDRLIGGPGDDSLGGGTGDDFCRGSAGADRYFQCETGVV